MKHLSNMWFSFIFWWSLPHFFVNVKGIDTKGNLPWSPTNLQVLNDTAVLPDYKIVLSIENPREYISSPGFPYEDYSSNIQIIYEIELKLKDEIKQASNRILLTFEMFMLQESPFCTKDGVEIADASNQVRVYCGSQVGRTILSESSTLQIRFFSDASIESRGYSILLEMYNTGCSKQFEGVNSGTFSSPNFPGAYYADDLCVWKIVAPEGKRIEVKFGETFDIRAYEPLCVQDYLAISLTGDFNTHIKRYCHGKRPVSVYSTGNNLLLMFRTDCCFEGKGFSASFIVLDEEDITTSPPPEPKPNVCSCGKENEPDTERIMGGQTVSPPSRYPWIVALVKEKNGKNDFFCGGTLINRQYILTASHCIEKEIEADVGIALGAHNSESSQDLVPVGHFVMHPDYKNRTYINDIALIKLQDPVDFTETVSPICLPAQKEFTSPKDLAVVAGWGWQRFNFGQSNTELQEVQVPIVSNPYCVSKYGGVILDTNLCAGGEEGKDACAGDSGGPLFTKYDGVWYSAGVVSWGMSCGIKDYPGVYTRVSEYLDWIRDETSDAPPCDDEDIAPPVQPNLDDCGIPNSHDSERIAGGKEAKPFEFPWMAMIVYDKTIVGAGALINPYYVITAASLFDTWIEWYPEVLDVFLGKHYVSKREATSKKYDVERVYHHPQYGKPTPYNNDMALMKLKTPYDGVAKIYRPICLPRTDAWYPPDMALTTAGWGRTSNNGPGSDVLLKTDMDVWDEEECEKRYPKWFTEKMLCAYRYGTDTCEGDKGAPLMRLYYGRYLHSWSGIMGKQ
ncbi:transmembrane protease serine 9-like [Uloborus diversus]|uniref:transmembrane protease serine 9-like n=1 Tax=Uloborus diversus TaxID=327109 RepID=UPI00240A655B|nr:transmembrane protease serine 9-like [Uloborus diversus]